MTATFDDLTARIAALESKDITVADLPMAHLQQWLSQRWLTDALNDSRPATTRSVYNLTGSGPTAALGSAFQVLPSLTQTLTLTAGALVLLRAEVQLSRTANTPSAFWVVNPAAGGQTNYPGADLVTTGQFPVSPSAAFIVPADGGYTFSVQAVCVGGGGVAGPGNATILVES